MHSNRRQKQDKQTNEKLKHAIEIVLSGPYTACPQKSLAESVHVRDLGMCSYSLTALEPHLSLTWGNLVHAVTVMDFIFALSLLCLERLISPISSIHLTIILSSTHCYHHFLSCAWRDFWEIFNSVLSVPRSFTLHIVYPWVSVFVTMQCRRRLL